MLSLGGTTLVVAKEPSERFKGYNSAQGKWVVGNLGKDYAEGDFVSYQLRIDSDSKMWGATEFSISYNFFQPSSGAIYVDGFDTSVASGFQWSTGDFLPDGTDIPSGWPHVPTPAAGESWVSGPRIVNYMDAWPPGSSDGSPAGSAPNIERYFTVKGIPWPTNADHIILFFRAHLSLDIIWSNGLESGLPTSLDGGAFNGWTAQWKGSSFATGSSRHFTLQFEGVGDKTIPIPIVQYPTGMVSGYKIVHYCNGIEWLLAPSNGWQITLTGMLLGQIPFTQTVVTGTSPWATGYFEFDGLIQGTYTLTEVVKPGYTAWTGPFTFNLDRGETKSFNFFNEGPTP